MSEAANLALHALMLLAADPSRPVQTREVCEALSASRNHLEKVMQRLVRAGLVTSTRGPRGGFVLAKAPAKVTLLHVYEAIEGEVEHHACLLGKKRCTGECMLGDLVSRANAEITDRLGRTRLSDVANAFKRRQ